MEQSDLDDRGFGPVDWGGGGPWSSAPGADDFNTDHAKALDLSGGDERFRRVMNGCILEGRTWESLAAAEGERPEQRKNFKKAFYAQYPVPLRRYAETMKSYDQPLRKTLVERQAAEHRNSPEAKARNAKPAARAEDNP